jgi:hypothetical protein
LGDPTAGFGTWPSSNVFQFTPSTPLAVDAYRIRLFAGIQSAAFAVLSAFTDRTFTVSPGPFEVTSVVPSNNAVDVAPTSNIVVTFSRSVWSSLVYYTDGVNQSADHSFVLTVALLGQGAQIVDNTVKIVWSDNNKIATLDPMPLLPARDYRLTIKGSVTAEDDGSELSNGTDTFVDFRTAADPLAVDSTEPAANQGDVPLDQVVRIRYNEPIKAGTVLANTVSLEEYDPADGGTWLPLTGTTTADGQDIYSLLFTPAAQLQFEKQYRVTVSENTVEAQLGSGNRLSVPYSFTFATPV